MNFRSYNHFLEFPIINRRFVPGKIDTWRTRRVPGRVFRGDSRGCRAVSEWSLGLGHAAQPEASEEISLGTRERSAFGASGRYSGFSRGESRDTWWLGGLPEEGFSLGTRKHVACSEGRSGRYLGAASKGLRGSFRLNLRDTWHVPKERPKGLFRRRVERGFRRNGFGLASGTGGTLRKAVRQGFRRSLRKEAFGRASGRFRKAPKEGSSFVDTSQTPEGLRKVFGAGLFEKGFPERASKGVVFERFHGGGSGRWILDLRLQLVG